MKAAKQTRPPVTTVQIRQATQRRLAEYREAQMPRPSMADLVTVAVDQYIDRQMAAT